jgi:hypothetical protein
VKNIGINLGWKLEIEDTMVVNSIIMTICISPFSKPCLDFDYMPKKFTLTYIIFFKSYSYISIWIDFTNKVTMV